MCTTLLSVILAGRTALVSLRALPVIFPEGLERHAKQKGAETGAHKRNFLRHFPESLFLRYVQTRSLNMENCRHRSPGIALIAGALITLPIRSFEVRVCPRNRR